MTRFHRHSSSTMPFALLLGLLLLQCVVLSAPVVAPAAPIEPVRPRVALLHMHDGVWFFQRLGSLTLANKRRYAARWKYDIITVTPQGVEGVKKSVACAPGASPPCFEPDTGFDIDHKRAPTFGKIKLARAACISRPHHWLFWSDADAMVVNQSVPLESIIDDGYDLIFAYDWLMLNAGMLLVKCTPWTEAFLAKVYDARKFDNARALDQSSLQNYLDALSTEERDAHVKVIPKSAMNVYLEEYRPGDFLLHMAGKLYEATEQGLWAIVNQFDILSQIDDVKSIAAFFQGKHLLNYYSGTCNRSIRPRQHECLPTDNRRIRLKESLGSMNVPNRYRHVALRYYFLQNWKDKYDVPGWNVKKKPLPMPVDSQRTEAQILAKELADIAEKEKAKRETREHAEKAATEKVVMPPPDVDTGTKLVANSDKNSKVKEDAEKPTNEKDMEEGPSTFLTLLACLFLIFIVGCVLIFFFRKRRRSLKIL